MSSIPPQNDTVKLLAGSDSTLVTANPSPSRETTVVTSQSPARQLSELPKDELEHLAEDFGLEPKTFKTRQDLVTAVHERRQLIGSFSREALIDVVRWGRRPVVQTASKEQLAIEAVRIKLMRFGGLSQQGLYVLARLRGIDCQPGDEVPILIRKLQRKESLFSRFNRKRRAMLGSIVSNMLGEDEAGSDYQFLPQGDNPSATATPPPRTSIKEEIEESGLFGGIAGRIKKSADTYLNQKLDEIEQRIDRKLDEIDRRLAEWRDKEVANRIKILKITLWASVIVGTFSLIYSYFVETWKTYHPANPPPPVQDVRPAK